MAISTPVQTAETTETSTEVQVPLALAFVNPFGTVEHFRSLLNTVPEFVGSDAATRDLYARLLRQFARRARQATNESTRRSGWRTAADDIEVARQPMNAWLEPVLSRVHEEAATHYNEGWQVLAPLMHDAMVDALEPFDDHRRNHYTGGRLPSGGTGAAMTRFLRWLLDHAGVSADDAAATLRTTMRRSWAGFVAEEGESARLASFVQRLIAEGVDVPDPGLAPDRQNTPMSRWEATMEAMSHEALIAHVKQVHADLASAADRRGLCEDYDMIVAGVGWPRRSEMRSERATVNRMVHGRYKVALTDRTLAQFISGSLKVELPEGAPTPQLVRDFDIYIAMPASENRYRLARAGLTDEMRNKIIGQLGLGRAEFTEMHITSIE